MNFFIGQAKYFIIESSRYYITKNVYNDDNFIYVINIYIFFKQDIKSKQLFWRFCYN